MASSNTNLILLLLWNLVEPWTPTLWVPITIQWDKTSRNIYYKFVILLLQWDPTPLRDAGKPLEWSEVKLCSVQMWGQICFINLNSLKTGHTQMTCAFIIDQNIKLTRMSFPSYWLKRIYCSWKRTCKDTIYHIYFFSLERDRNRSRGRERQRARFLTWGYQKLIATNRSENQKEEKCGDLEMKLAYAKGTPFLLHSEAPYVKFNSRSTCVDSAFHEQGTGLQTYKSPFFFFFLSPELWLHLLEGLTCHCIHFIGGTPGWLDLAKARQPNGITARSRIPVAQESTFTLSSRNNVKAIIQFFHLAILAPGCAFFQEASQGE